MQFTALNLRMKVEGQSVVNTLTLKKTESLHGTVGRKYHLSLMTLLPCIIISYVIFMCMYNNSACYNIVFVFMYRIIGYRLRIIIVLVSILIK